MELVTISPSIQYIGVDDKTIDLFESQYIVPHGISYNSYVILDEKIAVMDTVDARATGPWLKNLADVLGDRKPDYLVVSHMEPDHASNIQTLAEKYPDMKIVASAKALSMIPQFFTFDISDRSIVAKEGET
ncbi:MAG: MBL fold metallo-hydrolase, partial [Christensenellales bacterium]